MKAAEVVFSKDVAEVVDVWAMAGTARISRHRDTTREKGTLIQSVYHDISGGRSKKWINPPIGPILGYKASIGLPLTGWRNRC